MNELKFSTLMQVRITDINYGRHVGLSGIAGIFQQARLLYLKQYGVSEINIEEDIGIMLVDCNYQFKREILFDNQIKIDLYVRAISKYGFTLKYKALKKDDNLLMVEALEKFICVNYDQKKIVSIPQRFLTFLRNNHFRD